jgi:hypothetical protein
LRWKKQIAFALSYCTYKFSVVCHRALGTKKPVSFVADENGDAVRTAGKLPSNFALANYTGSPGGA